MKLITISILVLTVALAALIALLSHAYPPVMKAFFPVSKLMDAYLPISRFSSRSSHPDVAYIYCSIAILVIPLSFAASVSALVSPLSTDLRRIDSISQLVRRFFAGLLLTVLAIVGFATYAGQSMRTLPVGDSLAGLILLGWIPFAAIGGVLGAGLVYLWKSISFNQ